MKKRITLELGTAELNTLLSAIESILLTGMSEEYNGPRGVPALEAALADDEHSDAWSVLALASSYRQLVAHWPQKGTAPSLVMSDQMRAREMLFLIQRSRAVAA